MSYEDLYLTEYAKFSIYPQFMTHVREYPELLAYRDIMLKLSNVAEECVNDTTYDMRKKKVNLGQLLTLINMVLRDISDINSVFAILLLNPVSYVFSRCSKYFADYMLLFNAADDLRMTRENLIRIIKSSKDRKVTAECRNMLKEVDKVLTVLENDEYRDKVKLYSNPNVRYSSRNKDIPAVSILNEAADMRFWPTFSSQLKKYPELAQYEALLQEAKRTCEAYNQGVPSITFGRKFAKILLKYLNLCANIDAVAVLFVPVSVIFKPFIYLFDILMSALIESGEQMLAVNDLQILKVQIEENMKCTRNPKAIAEYKKLLKKADETIYRLNNDTNTEHQRERARLKTLKAMKTESYYDDADILIDDYTTERADVQAWDLISIFTPTLCRKYPEMKKYKSVAADCEKYFKNNDIKGTNGTIVLGKLNKLFNEILVHANDVVYIGSLLTANIPGIILTRIIKCISLNNAIDSGKQTLLKHKTTLENCKAKCKNGIEKAKIDKLIAKCDDAINKLENNTHDDHIRYQEQRRLNKIRQRDKKKADKQAMKDAKIAERKAKREQFGKKHVGNNNDQMNESTGYYEDSLMNIYF